MTRRNGKDSDAGQDTVDPHPTAPGSLDPSRPNPFFNGTNAFEAEMLRVATLDLDEPGSGCMPFILATADLSLEARRDLLIKTSGALLDLCDRHGAAECLKFALGLEHVETSEELDQVIEDGLQLIAETAVDDPTGPEELARIIEEAHQNPRA